MMENNLWNKIESDAEYDKNKSLYHTHIFEQYKLCVEMADKISSRRNSTNIFFLSLNSTLLAVIGFSLKYIPLIQNKFIILLPAIALIIICIVWGWLLRSYRNLNTAKFKVIGHLEKRLPSSPFWAAEWKELGEGKDFKKYLPLTALEVWVPIIFGIVYILTTIYVLCVL